MVDTEDYDSYPDPTPVSWELAAKLCGLSIYELDQYFADPPSAADAEEVTPKVCTINNKMPSRSYWCSFLTKNNF